ncbi:hypothetical protein RESH_03862 [Rhodopirellula europaea SH398]|uniref:Uncharacterized protein n=1 Tax=Rhodopirellula europaea SH398 TaxID=1263868 RepID=M5S232_9BACT|nr:hypothetical protein RESH_03862 [Rhodopirellula europaea SH398]
MSTLTPRSAAFASAARWFNDGSFDPFKMLETLPFLLPAFSAISA